MTDVSQRKEPASGRQHEAVRVCQQAAPCSSRRLNIGQSANIQVVRLVTVRKSDSIPTLGFTDKNAPIPEAVVLKLGRLY